MPLTAGTRLGAYEIIAPIGAGGMGEVYRATDTKLRREVAVKVLPDAFTRDHERMIRFEREAQVLAALNHPNIAAIYGLEESSGHPALVMELVEGETLSELISGGPIAAEEALALARQIAAGLEFAHEKGIVHRDLKPANIKITPNNTVKILDFGLAKAMGGDSVSDPDSASTVTVGATQPGVILGTAAYMAPEQARGKNVDKRADIWAFGVVLFEMLAGRRPFSGEDFSEILASVIKEEPKWDRAPQRFQPLLRRCLEKDPAKRLRDIGDAMPLVGLAPVEIENRRSLPWVAAATAFFLVALVALPFAILHLHEQPAFAPTVRFEMPPPPKGTFDVYMALSPDGHHLAFTSAGPDGILRIWVRDLDTVQARALPGTENAQSLFWSPDSRYIAFGFGTQLKKVDLSGGPPVTLCNSKTPVGSGAWSSTGTIVFGGRGAGPLQKVAESGGIPSQLTAFDPARMDVYHSHPSFLPDGVHFVYFIATLESQHGLGIYTGSLDAKPQEQNSKQLLATPTNAVFTPGAAADQGYLLFLRDGTLMAQPFDPRKLDLTGEPMPLAEGVGRANSLGNFSVSATGILAYRLGAGLGAREGRGDSDLVWLARDGKRLNAVLEHVDVNFETLSPDGKTLAYSLNSADGLEDDVWLYDIARGTASRFTFGPGNALTPMWSPDGTRIAYNWGSGGAPNDIYIKDANGASKESLLFKVGTPLRIYDWSRDGKFLVFGTLGTGAGLQLLAMEGDHKVSPYTESKFAQFDAQVSPDNRWMAYTSDESGANQVYVQPLPPTGGKWQISAAGGNRARWRKDGKELYFVDAQQNLMAVEVRAGATFAAGIPQVLFRTPISQLNPYQFFYIPAPDGQKFLMKIPAGNGTPPPVTVVLNWRSALKK